MKVEFKMWRIYVLILFCWWMPPCTRGSRAKGNVLFSLHGSDNDAYFLDTPHYPGYVKELVSDTFYKRMTQREQDPFLKWWTNYLVEGPEPVSNRIKPFYVNIDNHMSLIPFIIVGRLQILEIGVTFREESFRYYFFFFIACG